MQAIPLLAKLSMKWIELSRTQEGGNFMKYELDLMDARNEGLAEGKAHQQAEDIKLTAKLLHNLGIAKSEILSSLSDTYQLSPAEAKHYIKMVE